MIQSYYNKERYIKKIEQDLEETYVEQEPSFSDNVSNREIPLSSLDVKILNIAQSKGMICAE